MGRRGNPRTGSETCRHRAVSDPWKDSALAEISTIKSRWSERFGWAPAVRREADRIDLFVRFSRRRNADEQYVLRLRYPHDFRTAGRREAFVDPDDYDGEGLEFWPRGVRSLKLHEGNSKPPMICLEGTWGFHSHLHRDRDGRRAKLNQLLMELQACMDE